MHTKAWQDMHQLRQAPQKLRIHSLLHSALLHAYPDFLSRNPHQPQHTYTHHNMVAWIYKTNPKPIHITYETHTCALALRGSHIIRSGGEKCSWPQITHYTVRNEHLDWKQLAVHSASIDALSIDYVSSTGLGTMDPLQINKTGSYTSRSCGRHRLSFKK